MEENRDFKLSQQIKGIEYVHNFRELGGYRAINRKTIKHNIFFRSSALYKLTDPSDIETFLSFGIKTICDVRGPNERKNKPDPKFEGIKYNEITSQGTTDPLKIFQQLKGPDDKAQTIKTNFMIGFEGYQRMAFENDAYKQMFKDIVEGNVPILVHCAGGKDRTGVACALILALFGVEREDIVFDYMQSIPSKLNWINDNVEKLKKSVSPELADVMKDFFGCSRIYLEMMLNEVLFKYGSYDNYFEAEYGITPQMRKELIEKYTE